MILISEELIQNTNVQYYKGIDFNVAQENPKDGSGGFLFFFVDKWVDEVKKYTRESKIDNIIDSKPIKDFDMEQLNNDYICIYQTDGNFEVIYESIKNNMNNIIHRPWSAIGNTEIGKIPTNKVVSKKGNQI